MDTVSNPTATLNSPTSSVTSIENSALVAATGRASAISQIVLFGDLEAIISPSFNSLCDPINTKETTTVTVDQKETTTVTNFDLSTLLDDLTTRTQLGGLNSEEKTAWNSPSNVVSCAEITSSVMGAESWPALSESTRSSPKPSLKPKPFPSDIMRSYSDGSIYPAQLSLPSTRSSGTGTDDAPNNSVKHDNFANKSSSRDDLDLHQNGGQTGGGFGSQTQLLHPGNDHRPHRNSFRRGNGGSRFHGNGSVHNGYGERHSNQDRGNHVWNPNRCFLGSDAHIQPHRGPPLAPASLMRGPPPPPLPFVPAPQMPIHPLGMPAVYPDGQPLFYAQGPPNPFAPFSLGPPMLPMFNEPPHLQQLRANVVSQVDYYFSDKNLIKDMFLRQRMDDQGWVPIQLIAGFNKVKQLTNNVQFLLGTIRNSSIVEVEGEKVRRRNDWKKWLIPASLKNSNLLSPR